MVIENNDNCAQGYNGNACFTECSYYSSILAKCKYSDWKNNFKSNSHNELSTGINANIR